MARQKYQITKEDFYIARRWLESKTEKDWHKFHAQTANSDRAKEELDTIPLRLKCTKKDAATLQKWCDTYLGEAMLNQMKTTIRAERARAKKPAGSTKQITLDERAHMMLATIAKAENVTLSQAIEKHLQRQYMKVIGSDAGLQKDALDKSDR